MVIVLSLIDQQPTPSTSTVEEFEDRPHLDYDLHFSSETVTRFREAMQDCHLFVSDDNAIGIAPRDARLGDFVYIMKGASAPCILRHIAGNQWALVSGDCYLCRHNYPFYTKWMQNEADHTEMWNEYDRDGMAEEILIR